MARKRRVDPGWGIEQTDDLMDAMFDQAKKNFGDEQFYTGTEAEQLIVGLPLPALCLRYLFQSTVFPLSRMTIITGQQGSCKSAFLYEIFRWHRSFGGRNVLLECESKDSPDLRASILNYDQKACGVKPCESLEQWQSALTWLIEHNQALMTGTKAQPGPGRIIPFCIGIDSLMGKASEENIAKVLKQGYADRAHPLEALKISQFMKVWPQKLLRWPFSVVGTNHLKPTTDFMGRPGRNIPGGMSLKFQETYEIEMAWLGDLKRADHEGVKVSLMARKNSLGPSRKKIEASLVWWNEFQEVTDEETSETKTVPIQHTMWNWDSASIDLLLKIQTEDRTRWKKYFDPVLDLVPERGKGNVVWSKALDISEDEPVPYRVAGSLLEKRPDILNHIHGLLGIKDRLAFEPGLDFRAQLDKAKAIGSSATLPASEGSDDEPMEAPNIDAEVDE